MQIKKIHISNFGKLHEMQMDFSEGLNVINGENGWGKSTLAAFLKAMLYGMDVTTKRSLLENERRRYKPWQGGAYGGGMEFEANGKSYRMERFSERRNGKTNLLFMIWQQGFQVPIIRNIWEMSYFILTGQHGREPAILAS